MVSPVKGTGLSSESSAANDGSGRNFDRQSTQRTLSKAAREALATLTTTPQCAQGTFDRFSAPLNADSLVKVDFVSSLPIGVLSTKIMSEHNVMEPGHSIVLSHPDRWLR